MAKEYRLLKDTIAFKAGTVFEYKEQKETKDFVYQSGYYRKGVKISPNSTYYLVIHVENKPEWFEEIKGEQILSPINDQALSWDRELHKFIPLTLPPKVEDKNLTKKEPNYLITAFRFVKSKEIWKIYSNGLYGNGIEGGISSLEDMLEDSPSVKDGKIEIYSVKNSKGEEFTIGDKVYFQNMLAQGEVFEIDNFFINKEDIVLARSGTDRYAICENIRDINKIKTPLFTTTDGVEIFEGDVKAIYITRKDLSIPKAIDVLIFSFEERDLHMINGYLTFISKVNRDKYIQENTTKPIFTSVDGIQYYDPFNMDCNLFSVHPISWEKKRTRVKDCIIQHSEWLHFHTKEARQKYIDNNKTLGPAVVGGDFHIITYDEQDVVIGTQDLFSVFINRKEKRFDITKYDKSLTCQELQKFNTPDHLWFAIQEKAIKFCCDKESANYFEKEIGELINQKKVLSINDILSCDFTLDKVSYYKLRDLVNKRVS